MIDIEGQIVAVSFKVYKTKYAKVKNQTVEAVNEEFFTTNVLSFDKPMMKQYHELESFVIYTCVEGEMKVKYPDGTVSLKMGECLLIPNVVNDIELLPSIESKLLETYIL